MRSVDFEPPFGLRLRDDREDLDFLVGDVIENAYLFDAEAILRLREPAKSLDATLGDLRWFMPEVRRDGILDGCAFVGWECPKAGSRGWR